jgi:dynein heavy chain
MSVYLEEILAGITNCVRIVQNPDLEKGYRRKVMVIITMEVHSRDVVGNLIREKVRKPTDFMWQAQLKLYWLEDKKDVELRIADAIMMYGYEYIGNGGRLVITSLTDRIYVTAT